MPDGPCLRNPAWLCPPGHHPHGARQHHTRHTAHNQPAAPDKGSQAKRLPGALTLRSLRRLDLVPGRRSHSGQAQDMLEWKI